MLEEELMTFYASVLFPLWYIHDDNLLLKKYVYFEVL